MINKEQVINVIADALRVDTDIITLSSSSTNIDNWDSLGHLSILTALDKMFDGKIANISEMAEAESIERILDLLSQNSLI